MNHDPEIDLWERSLSEEIAQRPGRVNRAIVLRQCGSTQDEALKLSERRPGLAVYALRQTGGRGRLGRVWEQQGELGIAATFTVGACEVSLPYISLAAGVAALRASLSVIGGRCLGLRWPNDVVERPAMPYVNKPARKVAGVLVEQREGLFLVGIGINVLQEATGFSPSLRERATSLKLLGNGQPVDRLRTAVHLLREFSIAMTLGLEQLTQISREHDVLIGSRQVFEHDGRRFRGIVESIEPTAEIVVRTDTSGVVRLPAMTTSLVPDE